ncbi:MAG: helix-turn-helix domain-containing protein [Longimicrobiales bacterium]
MSEIARRTGINKTSTFRFVNTLVRLGYLRKSEEKNLLRLGPRAWIDAENDLGIMVFTQTPSGANPRDKFVDSVREAIVIEAGHDTKFKRA